MAPKKGRRVKRGDEDSDDELKPQASVSTEATEASVPVKKTSKKKQVCCFPFNAFGDSTSCLIH